MAWHDGMMFVGGALALRGAGVALGRECRRISLCSPVLSLWTAWRAGRQLAMMALAVLAMAGMAGDGDGDGDETVLAMKETLTPVFILVSRLLMCVKTFETDRRTGTGGGMKTFSVASGLSTSLSVSQAQSFSLFSVNLSLYETIQSDNSSCVH